MVVEIRSPGDESYEKLPFHAGLGVPEVWIIHRDTKVPEIRVMNEDGEYELLPPDPAGWHISPSTGLQMRDTPAGKLRIRAGSDDGTATELPDSRGKPQYTIRYEHCSSSRQPEQENGYDSTSLGERNRI